MSATAQAPHVRRAVAFAVAVVLAVEVVFLVTTLLRKPPRGPANSSYAAGHRGVRGFARLLEKGGHEVRRQRVPVDVERPDPADTVVVLEGETPSDKEVAALGEFVRAGGRLVVAGSEKTDEWLSAMVGGLSRGSGLLACRPLANVAETRRVTYVESSGQAGWFNTGNAVPILGCNDSALAAVAALGEGRIVIVSDPAVFQNYLLGARENATFVLNAVGGVRRDVVFLENLHGFGAPSGLAAIPLQAQVAVGILLAAGAIALLSRRGLASGRVPDSEAADSPRSIHAEAVAERLAAAPGSDAAKSVRAAASRAIADAAGLSANAGANELRAAAARLGLPADDVALVLQGGSDDASTVAAGRVLAACHAVPRTTRPPRPKERDA